MKLTMDNKCSLCERLDCDKMASEPCIEKWYDNFMAKPINRIVMDRLSKI